MGNILIGYLFFGHVFSYSDKNQGIQNIIDCCTAYGLSPRIIKKSIANCPMLSKEYIRSAAHLLQAVASYLCMERMVTLKKEELPIQIDNFIMEHLTESLDAKMICEHFNISKTHLYGIARQSYGMGIAEHIRRLRITKAQNLLISNPQMRVSEISFFCGFSNYNYFITIFKRVTGLSPNAYRQAASKETYKP